MKQERNNEMDLLLRRLGRGDGATVSDAAGDHLDADELSAYAENAVPAGARARYTAHVADCRRCRELVVQLNASAGVVIAAASATAAKPSVLRSFLASLFTPMVLRYAAPALGLIIVAVIGFMSVRQNDQTGALTQVTNSEQPQAPLPPAVTSQPDLEGATKPSATPKELRDPQERGLPANSAPAGKAAPTGSVEGDLSKDAPAAPPKVEQQAASANEPAAPKPSATTEASVRTTAADEQKKEVAQAAPAAAPASERSLRAAQREERKTDNDDARSGSAMRKAEPADKVSSEGTGSVANLQRDGFSSSEARTVAGRRFRKQRGVWTDTAYDSSRETMTVARGSEQYRALIADEPEIKTIADQLGGEIIVVWKGRAYRIR